MADSTDFVRQAIAEDVAAGRFGGRVQTRFPPEPNGYLHIGHVKAICINFEIAKEHGAVCNLRFDDTNPTKESVEYANAIEHDIRWLGYDWPKTLYASDYFEALHGFAIKLIKAGKAFVDHSSAEEISRLRGRERGGEDSPYRNRSVEENLALFEKMCAGELAEGECVLRAKIDMRHPNPNLRDPTLYRIMKATHHRTGDRWKVYPMYDWAHGQSDSLEGVTHSLCSLEFEDHRPLYNWFCEQLEIETPRQIEFARLNMTHCLMSKRHLLRLVEGGHVKGWDDPRMPTVAGLRRRGYPAEALRDFVKRVGVAKYNSTVDHRLLEFVVREVLNRTATRRLGVLDPLKLVVTNYPEGEEESFEAQDMPGVDGTGTRQVPFARELWIDRDCFAEDPPKGWKRLAPGWEVRLRYACLVTCTDVVKDASGKVTEVHCTWDPESRGGATADNRKVKGTIHWVSAKHALDAEVRLYDHLFPESPDEGEGDVLERLNPNSLTVVTAKVEPSLAAAEAGTRLQLERVGYFAVDPDSAPGKLVLNRTVTLKDGYKPGKPPAPPKGQGKQKQKPKPKPAKPAAPTGPAAELAFEQFAALDLRVARVKTAEPVEGADRLLKIGLELADGEQRTVVSGIRAYYSPEALVGRQVVYLANLKPRKLRGVLSQGMILAANGPEGEAILLEPERALPDGAKVT
ncbi:MAG: glutamine--tRNA ligase/YqeY domain fusion protein [Planctomycetes bacterium]|nr:glutamine--tRNA ligase/YqeY domain fusion protein [Planctomycetota bacterium]